MFWKEIVNYKKFNDWNFALLHNGKNIKIELKRIKTIKQVVDNLVFKNLLKDNNGFFFHNKEIIFSLGFTKNIDLVWVDFNNKIIHIEENFLVNKMSKKIENSKYVYLLPSGKIQENKILLNDILSHRKLTKQMYK